MAIFQRIYDYTDAPILKKFSEDDRFFRVVMGPFGSGKSSACVAVIMEASIKQAPNQQGIRRTRWAAIRNSYPQLKDTTIRTFFDWVPPEYFGTYNIADKRYLINKIALSDGTTVEAEILFRALDDDKDVRNLLSLELTGAWINEMREVPKAIADGIEGRVGRFPAGMDGWPTWHGVIGDTNPPDDESYIYKLFEEDVPNDPIAQKKYVLYKQPSGLSEQAENKKNLIAGYYDNMAVGKDPEWVKVYVHGEYGHITDGKPIFTNYLDQIHLAEKPIQYIKTVPLIIGMDFGLNPTAIFTQLTPKGKFNILRELYMESCGLERFLRDSMRPMMTSDFPGCEYVVCGDPSGASRADTDEKSCFDILRQYGIKAVPATTNTFMGRFNAVDSFLTRLIEGKGALQLDPSCRTLRRGFIGEYKRRKLRIVGKDQFATLPVKNEYSHTQDGLQYAALYATEGHKNVTTWYGSRYQTQQTTRKSDSMEAFI